MSSAATTHEVVELAKLSELIDEIYRGATEPGCWNRILPKVADWVNAKSGLLFTPLHPPQNGGFYFNHGIPEAVMHLWSTRWAGEDVLSNAVQQRGLFVAGMVLRGEDVLPQEEIRQSPIWRELNHPNQIDNFLISAVFDPTSPNVMATALSFYRSDSEGPFTLIERDRLAIVLPHISRAFGVMMKLREADIRVSANLAALDRIGSGVLLFNVQGAVTFANRVARRILEEEDGLHLRHRISESALGDILADDTSIQDELTRAIHGAISPDILHTEHFSRAIVIPRPSGRQGYMLSFSTLGTENELGGGNDAPCAIAFLIDGAAPIKLDSELMQRTYGLTHAEMRIAEVLTEGMADKEIAFKLGLSPHTIKVQLRSIYCKTNTNSRTKLMKLLVSLSQVC